MQRKTKTIEQVRVSGVKVAPVGSVKVAPLASAGVSRPRPRATLPSSKPLAKNTPPTQTTKTGKLTKPPIKPDARVYLESCSTVKPSNIKRLKPIASKPALPALKAHAYALTCAGYVNPTWLRYDLNRQGGVGWPVFIRNKYHFTPPKIFINANSRLRLLLKQPPSLLTLSLNLALDTLNTPPLPRLPCGLSRSPSPSSFLTKALIRREAKVWYAYTAFRAAAIDLLDQAAHAPTKAPAALQTFIKATARLSAKCSR